MNINKNFRLNDSFSFIKYVEIKEKKYKKYEKMIESKIKQIGGDTIEIFTLQNELLKIKKKLNQIEESRKNVVIDPYDKFKHLIDSINSKVSNIETEINGVSNSNDLESKMLINKIKEIDILIDSTASDYKTVQTDRKLQFMREKIDPATVTKVFDEYINDTSKLVADLKTKMGGGTNLVKNQEIKENIDAIDLKIKAYDEKMEPIIGYDRTTTDETGKVIKEHTAGIVEEINEYINQMESLYLGNEEQKKEALQIGEDQSNFNIVLMDKDISHYINGFLIEPKDDQKDKIIVKPEQMKDDAEFSFYKDLVDKVDGDKQQTEDEKNLALISPKFIQENLKGGNYNVKEENFKVGIKKVQLNKTMKELYEKWSANIKRIRIENEDILQYQIIKDKLLLKMKEFNNFFLYNNSISNLISSGLKEKTSILQIELERIKETLENCNILLNDFNTTKVVNADLASKCKMIDIHDTNILDDIKKELEVKKEEIIKKIELSNTRLADPDFIIQLVKERSPEQATKLYELNNLHALFINNIEDIRLLKLFKNMIHEEQYINSSYQKINYLDAFIKFRDHPVGNTERYEYNHLIKHIDAKINLNDFIIKVKKINTELEKFPNKEKQSVIDDMNRIKKSLEKNLYLINDYLNYKIIEKSIQQTGGEDMHINDFILKLAEFEMKIREMKIKRNEVKKLIKKYNVRYTQFFNFQKYIVNYVSLVLAQEEYEYWNLISKGSISFYENILRRLEDIVDKFENPALYKENNYKTKENIWFYSKHFFIIKILRQFFSELYAFWDLQDTQFKKDKSYDSVDSSLLSSFTEQVKKKIAANEDGYQGLDEQKIKLKAIRLFKRSIANVNPWSLKYKINTLADSTSSSVNKNYFFLFNLFVRILDVYQMKLPPVANYMRINFNNDVPSGNTTFVKDTKNFLKEDTILKCFNVDLDNRKRKDPNAKIDPDAIYKAEAVKKIKFEEIFDPDNFQENDALAMYMGLGNMLTQGKSVMLLTYGYSGVGKTFTLFGTKGIDGMLQSTLNGLSGSPAIEMKAFELYGLGVPYKFYWEANKFTHFIYKYELADPNLTRINPNPVEFKDDHIPYKDYLKNKNNNNSFNNLLDSSLHYTPISTKHIKSFEEIVTNIDNIRKSTGRIKSTVNNPESSRSIMIYDFKIKLPTSSPRLVVMDLPGKENLYQTYCEQTSNKRSFEPRDRFVNHRTGPKVDDEKDYKPSSRVEPDNNQTTDDNLFNPEGSVTGPGSVGSEGTARSNSTTQRPINYSIDPNTANSGIFKAIISNLKANNINMSIFDSDTRRALTKYDPTVSYASIKEKFNLRGGAGQYDIRMIKAMMYINPLWMAMVPEIAEHFDDTQNFNSHLISEGNVINLPTLTSYGIEADELTRNHIQEYISSKPETIGNTLVYTSSSNASHISEGVYKEADKRALYGLTSRAMAQITNMINEEYGLERLGEKINNMLVDKDFRMKRYGYAGLEGIYINENILGLLEVLGEKIQKIRDPSKETTVSVVCSQNEVYKKLITGTSSANYPIGWKDLINNGNVVDDKFIENPSILVKDNEFISQIMILRNILKSSNLSKTKIIGDEFFEPNSSDRYNNYIRGNTRMKIDRVEKGLSDDLEDNTKNWINNYNYNNIFNIKNPPIKSILAPYLDDDDFKNFYLFFVSSNNIKESTAGNIDTCTKQIQLMYDTRHFMDVIAHADSKGIGSCPI